MVCFATQRNREKIINESGKQRRKHTSLWRRLFFRFLGVGLVGLFDPLLMNWSQLSLLSTGRLPPLRGSYKEKWGSPCQGRMFSKDIACMVLSNFNVYEIFCLSLLFPKRQMSRKVENLNQFLCNKVWYHSEIQCDIWRTSHSMYSSQYLNFCRLCLIGIDKKMLSRFYPLFADIFVRKRKVRTQLTTNSKQVLAICIIKTAKNNEIKNSNFFKHWFNIWSS